MPHFVGNYGYFLIFCLLAQGLVFKSKAKVHIIYYRLISFCTVPIQQNPALENLLRAAKMFTIARCLLWGMFFVL